MTREKLQNSVVKSFKYKDCVICEFATGVGKSLSAIKIHQLLHEELFYASKKVLLLVAETSHKRNWMDEYIKHGYEGLLEGIRIECYASMKNCKDEIWDFVIFDECHHLFSDKRRSLLNELEFRKGVFLSATLSRDKKNFIQFILGSKKLSYKWIKFDLDDAINNDIIKPFNVINHVRYLKDTGLTEDAQYSKVENRVKVKKTYKVTELKKYERLLQSENYWAENSTYKLKALMAKMDTKRWIASKKEQIVEDVVKKNNDRCLIFTFNVEFADHLNDTLTALGKRCGTIHTGVKNIESIIENYKNGDIDILIAVGMLKEGVNLNKLNKVYIHQLDSGVLSFIQRSGRGLRESNAQIHIFTLRGTKDDRYTDNIRKEIPDKFYQEL